MRTVTFFALVIKDLLEMNRITSKMHLIKMLIVAFLMNCHIRNYATRGCIKSRRPRESYNLTQCKVSFYRFQLYPRWQSKTYGSVCSLTSSYDPRGEFKTFLQFLKLTSWNTHFATFEAHIPEARRQKQHETESTPHWHWYLTLSFRVQSTTQNERRIQPPFSSFYRCRFVISFFPYLHLPFSDARRGSRLAVTKRCGGLKIKLLLFYCPASIATST